VSEAATALGISPTTVRRRIADGRLTARREPYRQAFRWLVQLPPTEAPATHLAADRLAVTVVRETDDELRAIAARVDLARHAVVEVLERERTVALRQAELLEQLAAAEPAPLPEAPPDNRSESDGSRLALLISVIACLGAVAALAFLALPAWSTGIIGAIGVVAGLVGIVEGFLLVTSWVGSLSARRQRSA
jgi:hypothetical protein